MEYAVIAALLKKYWLAETTVEEEKVLAAYFSQPSVAPELEPYRDLFGWYEQEAALTPGQGLENKILEAIRQADSAQSGNPAGHPGVTVTPAPAPVRPLYRHAFRYAAAAVILIGLGIYLMVQPFQKTGPQTPGAGISLAKGGHDTAQPLTIAETHPRGAAITDTYDDPQQALAAIRKALFTASAKMNKGKKIAQKHMDRMSNDWQSALGN